MKKLLIFSVLLALQKQTTTIKKPAVTPDVKTRIAMLKSQIADEIMRKQIEGKEHMINQFNRQPHQPIDRSGDILDHYEYIENENMPITPIMDFDERKLKDRFKMKLIKSTTKVTTTKFKPIEGPLRSRKPKRKLKKSKALKPKDIFYRRNFDESKMNSQLEWVHCQDLITPFIMGHKVDIEKPKRVGVKDNVVLRLVQLLSTNMTGHTRDDIYSIMYQISNLQLRFYQWDISALKLLFNVIVKGKYRSFKGLKHGVKQIFDNWHLDIGNITNLLKQSRIFRPPCIRSPEHDGSTKTPKGHRVATKSTTKKQCSKDMVDYDDECVKITIKY